MYPHSCQPTSTRAPEDDDRSELVSAVGPELELKCGEREGI